MSRQLYIVEWLHPGSPAEWERIGWGDREGAIGSARASCGIRGGETRVRRSEIDGFRLVVRFVNSGRDPRTHLAHVDIAEGQDILLCRVCERALDNKRYRRGHFTCSEYCDKREREQRIPYVRPQKGGCGSFACKNGFPHTITGVGCDLKVQ